MDSVLSMPVPVTGHGARHFCYLSVSAAVLYLANVIRTSLTEFGVVVGPSFARSTALCRPSGSPEFCQAILGAGAFFSHVNSRTSHAHGFDCLLVSVHHFPAWSEYDVVSFFFLSSQQRVPVTHQRKRGFAAAVSVRIRDAPRAHLFAVQEPNHELSVLVMRVNFFGIPKENGSLMKPCHGFCPCPKAQAQRTL